MTATAPTLHSPAWFEERRGGIGSSDAPIITGDAPWGDLHQLWAVKSGIVDELPIDTPRTSWGLRLEEVVADAYTERTGRRVRRVNRVVRHPQLDWMRASLDRVAVGEKRVVELKTARYPDDRWGPDGTAEIPDHYLVQVQHQLAVTGYDVADVPVLFTGFDLRVYTIPRDAALIEALIELEGEFWQCVVDRKPPAPLLERARRVAPLREGQVEADEALEALLVQGHAARQAKAEAEARSKEIDEAVKAALDGWTGARGRSIDASYKPNRDGTKVGWEFIAKAYRKTLEQLKADHYAGPHVDVDLDAVESMFTTTTPGARPLRYVPHKEEATDANR